MAGAATGAAPSYIYVIKNDMKNRVEKTKAEIAKMLPVETVKAGGYEYEQKDGKWTNKGGPGFFGEVKLEDPKVDSVNHPAHYKVGGIETIDFIEAKKLNYHLGNVVKYITRADHKGDRMEDLHKARWYLNREIARLEGAK